MKEYGEVLRIDLAYLRGITDSGWSESVLDDGTIESDDLRLSLELAGGHKFLLTGEQRFYIVDGYLVIEDLVQATE